MVRTPGRNSFAPAAVAFVVVDLPDLPGVFEGEGEAAGRFVRAIEGDALDQGGGQDEGLEG